MSISKKIALALLAAIAFACAFACAYAAPAAPAATSAQSAPAAFPAIAWHHTSWTSKDGAPTVVATMTQTPDGWLWLGATTGLFRFDGARFERYAPKKGSFPTIGIAALLSLPNGDLWIGYRTGGIALLRDGELRNYGEKDDLPVRAVKSIVQAPDGRIWAALSAGVFVRDGERWKSFKAGLVTGPGAQPPSTLMVDSRGTLWAITDKIAYRMAPGAAAFERLPIELDLAGSLTEAADGSIWSRGGRNFSEQMLAPPVAAATSTSAAAFPGRGSGYLMFDHDQGRWARMAVGVSRRYQVAGRAVEERLGAMQGLSGEHVIALLTDMEDNVWVSTDGGIDRFRRNKLSVLNLPRVQGAEGRAIAAGPDGDIWTEGFHVPRFDVDPIPIGMAPATPLTEITTMYRDPDGVIWAGSFGKLAYLKDGEFVDVALPDGTAGHVIHAIAKDQEGTLWISMFGYGIAARRKGGDWEHLVNFPVMPGAPALTITADHLGRVWFGYTGNRIAMRDKGKLTLLSAEQGVAVGTVFQIVAEGKHVWISGDNGLAHYDGQHFVPIKGVGDDPFLGTSGIARSPDGRFWLHGSAGISAIAHDELLRAAADPAYRVRYERWNFEDGLRGLAPQLAPLPSAIAGSDGRMWFTASNSVVSIDPTRVFKNPLVPAVQILGVSAGGKRFSPDGGIRFSPGTKGLEFDYTALSLTVPERVNFKYRLEGVDKDWQDAGTRRSAFYTNMGPGDYRFSVKASNNDGVWNETGASLSFTIAPTLTQSLWFRVLAALLLALALWALYRYRLHSMARRIHGRLEERIGERERIARELHDTFLQSVQGMVYNVQAAAMRIPQQEPGRVMVEDALQLADDVLLEGRERIKTLRSAGTHTSLEEELDMYARLWHKLAPAAFGVKVTGASRCLHPVVHEEVLAIAREALNNAFKHAHAANVGVELNYGAHEFCLLVTDDGQGIAQDVLMVGGVEGHWGLSGMRERAEKIKGKLSVRCVGTGTEVKLCVPNALAYGREENSRFWTQLFGKETH